MIVLINVTICSDQVCLDDQMVTTNTGSWHLFHHNQFDMILVKQENLSSPWNHTMEVQNYLADVKIQSYGKNPWALFILIHILSVRQMCDDLGEVLKVCQTCCWSESYKVYNRI